MKTIAVIYVGHEALFNWLGDRPVVAWSLERLRQVRGLDRVVVCAPPGVAARRHGLGVEVAALPDAVRTRPGARPADYYAWLASNCGPAAGADCVLFKSASLPLLSAASLEACVAAVRRSPRAAAVPALHYRTDRLFEAGSDRVPVPLPGVLAYAVPAPDAAAPVRRLVDVHVWEALDYLDPDARTLLRALVDSGEVAV